MEQYKFQALLKLGTAGADGGAAVTAGRTQRALVRAGQPGGAGSIFFPALVTSYGDGAEWLPVEDMLVTIVVRGDHPRDYLEVGESFSLWRGQDVASGVVTRHLYV